MRSRAVGQVGPHHHPWRVFAGLSSWRLRWADLPPGHYGWTCWQTRTVTLAEGLSQAERRCTIAHETEHILRGPATRGDMREELEIDRAVSRLLVPSVQQLADALAWARGHLEVAADELWVDDLTLSVRLSGLYGLERSYLDRRLTDVMLD